MNLRLFVHTVAVVFVSASALHGQATTFPLKHCDDPKPVLGLLRKSGGVVQFRLNKDGKPDVGSVGVVTVLGISPAGFRSAAERQLGACQFVVSKDQQKAITAWPVVVTVDVTAAAENVTFDAAVLVVGERTLIASDAAKATKDTMPLAFDDPRIEEYPRSYQCSEAVRGPQVIHASGATPAQAAADARAQIQIAQEQYASSNSGTLTAIVRVGPDGKPGSQIQILKITNPAAAQSLGDRIGACRFAPARVQGVPVPAFMEYTKRG